MSQQQPQSQKGQGFIEYALIIVIIVVVVITILPTLAGNKTNRGGFAPSKAYAAEIAEDEPYTTVAWTDMVYTDIFFVAVSPYQGFTAQDNEFVVLHVRTKPDATQVKTTITARFGLTQAIHSQDPNLTERVNRAFKDAQARGRTKRVDVYLYIDPHHFAP